MSVMPGVVAGKVLIVGLFSGIPCTLAAAVSVTRSLMGFG